MSVIRRLYGLRRVGHCGTLDPFADGLLPVVVGRATRAVQYMDGFDKAYRVRIRFGRRTDTMDLTGTTLEERPIPDDRMRRLVDGDDPSIHEAISSLVHIRSQVPPMYSAVKVEGRPLYDYARAGRDIERAARPVTIHEATVLQVAADETGLYTDALIRCSKGTYIRSLADTVGQATGLLAHASALTRLENGPYTLDQAFSWSQIMDAIDAGVRLPLLPVHTAFDDYPQVRLDPLRAKRLSQGQPVRMAGPVDSPDSQTKPRTDGKTLLAVYSEDGFIGLGRIIESTQGPSDGAGHVLTAERMFLDLEHHQK